MSNVDDITGEGSFRGAKFYISESRSTFGRRNQVHNYPQRNTPWTEDRGKAEDRWSVECFVVGPDYKAARDALIKAMKADGPGTLVHPYIGTVRAVCAPSDVVESPQRAGTAEFSLLFVEAGQNTAPTPTPDTQAQAVAAATSAKAAAVTNAAGSIALAGQVTKVSSRLQGLIGQVQAQINQGLAPIQAAVADVFTVQQAAQAVVQGGLNLLNAPKTLISDLFTAAGGLGDLGPFAAATIQELGDLVGTDSGLPAAPAALAVQVFDAVQALADAAPFADDALAQTAVLMTFGSTLPTITGSTPTLAAEAQNQTTVVQLVQSAAAAAAVNVVADMVFTSYDDAANVRDTLAAQIDTVALAIADTGDDRLADSVDALRLAMIQDVTARGASLARLYSYTPVTTEPAVVIAQRLYGDATRADEIVARNAIQHPGFVQAGQPLEVLTDA